MTTVNRRLKYTGLLASAALFLFACAAPISDAILKDVDETATLERIMKNPDALRGRTVLLGGVIVSVENEQGLTTLEIFEEPLDGRRRPSTDPDKSSGRFMAEVKGFLDPAIYAKGRQITVAGRVKGSVSKPLDKTTYAYPVIDVIEHHLFKKEEPFRPALHLGVGVGGRF
jgi:outer membrane lipoprotein